jgi:hypothetical protein
MNGAVPDRARQLAARLNLRFGDDARLAAELNKAQLQLLRANNRLWSGLHPDGMAIVYAEHPAAVDAASAHNRSEILGAPDPLREAQRVHWTVHHSFVAYQAAAERRRQLAADIGELAGELIATLVAVGWSEQEAREANVLDLANAREAGHHGTAS